MPRERESGRIDFVSPCRRCATLMGSDSRRGKKLRFETRSNAAIQGLCTKNTTSVRQELVPHSRIPACGNWGGYRRRAPLSRAAIAQNKGARDPELRHCSRNYLAKSTALPSESARSPCGYGNHLVRAEIGCECPVSTPSRPAVAGTNHTLGTRLGGPLYPNLSTFIFPTKAARRDGLSP